MICRIWHGRTSRENAPLYERVVRGEVIPGIERRRVPGFRHIDLLQRYVDTGVEFQTIMWFDDLQSVIEFAGEDYEASHVPPAAAAVLDGYDRRAIHFDVLDRRSQEAGE